MNRPAAARIVTRLARRIGCSKHFTPHSLRHSAITAVLNAGVSLRDVQEFARHADPRTTVRYDRARHSLDRRASTPSCSTSLEPHDRALCARAVGSIQSCSFGEPGSPPVGAVFRRFKEGWPSACAFSTVLSSMSVTPMARLPAGVLLYMAGCGSGSSAGLVPRARPCSSRPVSTRRRLTAPRGVRSRRWSPSASGHPPGTVSTRF
jgi:hypothetical protein